MLLWGFGPLFGTPFWGYPRTGVWAPDPGIRGLGEGWFYLGDSVESRDIHEDPRSRGAGIWGPREQGALVHGPNA